MFKSLNVKNFTVFAEADLEFSPALNVIVGENGTGKTHLLKLPYCVLASSAEGGRRLNGAAPTKAVLEARLSEKLVGVFRPESLGRLARRKVGQTKCEVQCRCRDVKLGLDFEFSTRSKEVAVRKLPTAWIDKPPVYLPTRELLTIYRGFVSVYESHYLDFEETWRDTCLLLGAPPVHGAREAAGSGSPPAPGVRHRREGRTRQERPVLPQHQARPHGNVTCGGRLAETGHDRPAHRHRGTSGQGLPLLG